ncbi:hypothetical protein Tdes44962_MAKER05991 [Teratosphaeria destructans]|uniref:Gfd2/YDR514C-like C-terminal domain-containing protein n=1 Tax=Teratosphaeria destructans TaxID=418781 RepID=A0A9W7VXZ7_9PEZI|nr:hypothetical protein Tdes44962_MAKER05991 [Teratosphaeria destructans]
MNQSVEHGKPIKVMPYTTSGRQEITLLQNLLGITPAGTAQTAPIAAPVFICIDCEAFEHDHSKVTEVGVAVLDCRDVIGLDPHDQQQWFNKMKHAHFRPVEYAKLLNSESDPRRWHPGGFC